LTALANRHVKDTVDVLRAESSASNHRC